MPYLVTFPQRVIDHFLTIVGQGQDSNECWLWPRSVGSHGYGQIGWQGEDRREMTTAHRMAWVAAGNTLPDDMTVDHICRTRACVNPSHLRLLTNLANASDNGQGAKTHCPRGHPYSGSNLYSRPNGHRECRRCIKDRRSF
jgi:hypothetical protein